MYTIKETRPINTDKYSGAKYRGGTLDSTSVNVY